MFIINIRFTFIFLIGYLYYFYYNVVDSANKIACDALQFNIDPLLETSGTTTTKGLFFLKKITSEKNIHEYCKFIKKSSCDNES